MAKINPEGGSCYRLAEEGNLSILTRYFPFRTEDFPLSEAIFNRHSTGINPDD